MTGISRCVTFTTTAIGRRRGAARPRMGTASISPGVVLCARSGWAVAVRARPGSAGLALSVELINPPASWPARSTS
ncbi:MAG: hypothetical protein E6J41_03450 [Chloroflexi bacterium]|nr:MAG: hypothetical protein E6J41_03450 [Chloroflexota bacterium]